MNDPYAVLTVLAAIVLSPFVGGLLFGIDRKLTARLQGRYGPPIVQPFYDFLKLWSKSRIVVNQSQMMYVYGYLLFTVTALCLLALRQDLLITIFVLAFGGVSLIMGAFAVKSPYANFGAQREILQMVAYEPILMLAAVAIYLQTGTFMVADIFKLEQPLLSGPGPGCLPAGGRGGQRRSAHDLAVDDQVRVEHRHQLERHQHRGALPCEVRSAGC